MFKYKKIVIFLVVSVLLLGSAILYTVISGMDSGNTVYNTQQKTNYQKEKEVDENSDYDTVSTDNVNEQIDGIVSGYLRRDSTAGGDYKQLCSDSPRSPRPSANATERTDSYRASHR